MFNSNRKNINKNSTNKFIFLLNIMFFTFHSTDIKNYKNEKIKFNEIIITCKNKNTGKNIELKKLTEELKLNLKFGNENIDVWHIYLFNLIKEIRFPLLFLLKDEKNPDLKKYFNTFDLLEIFTFFINLIYISDFLKEVLSDKEQKTIIDNMKYISVEILKDKIEKSHIDEILKKINIIMEIILNNLSNKYNLNININGKNVPIKVVKELLKNKEIVKILSMSFFLFLDTLKTFRLVEFFFLKDEDLIKLINYKDFGNIKANKQSSTSGVSSNNGSSTSGDDLNSDDFDTSELD